MLVRFVSTEPWRKLLLVRLWRGWVGVLALCLGSRELRQRVEVWVPSPRVAPAKAGGRGDAGEGEQAEAAGPEKKA